MKNLLAGMPRSLRWAWLGYIVSRFYFYVCFSAPASDVEVYYRYALAGVDRGLMPYQQIEKLEYPPVAYWFMLWPRYAMSERFVDPYPTLKEWIAQLLAYDIRFRGLMTLCDVVAFALFVGIVKRRRPDRLTWCMWGYTLTTSFLGFVLFERLDPGLTLALMGWAYGSLRADDPDEKRRDLWTVVAYAALGLGISYKLIPVLLAPFALLVDFARLFRREHTPRWWLGPLVFFATALGPYAYYYALVGKDLGRMFAFHADRGVEIEAVYATVMMFAAPAAELQPYYDYGCWNLGGAWERPLAHAATPLLIGVLGVLGLRCLYQAFLGRGYRRVDAYLAGTVVIPIAVCLSKVFSIQYLVWVFPLLILAAAEFCNERVFRAIVCTSIVSAALSGFIFPFHFVESMNIVPYSDERPAYWTLIESRERAQSPPPPKRKWTDDSPPPPENPSRPNEPLLGRLNDHGPPWWAMNIRNVLYVGCVLTVTAAWWQQTRRRVESAI